MMKIKFDDSSYIEINVINDSVVLTLSARDGKNNKNTIVNSAEITIEQFKELSDHVQSQILQQKDVE